MYLKLKSGRIYKINGATITDDRIIFVDNFSTYGVPKKYVHKTWLGAFLHKGVNFNV